jgi:RNA polymerase sigma-70 factor (ECF subfamily)
MVVIVNTADDAHALPAAADLDAQRVVERAYADGAARLVGLGRRLGLDEDEAWDAVQEAHVRLWRLLTTGSEPVRDPRAWLAVTTYRLAMDRHRTARRLRDLRQRLLPASFATHVDRTDRIAIWGVIDGLPERQRAALHLHYRLDLTFEEVGTAMGITAGAARTLASRGLSTVRAAITPPEEAEA